MLFREARKIFRFFKPLYNILLIKKLSNCSKSVLVNILSVISSLFYSLYSLVDNIYYLKILNVFSSNDIKGVRKILFSLRFLAVLFHFIRNLLVLVINRSNKQLLYIYSLQTLGLAFDFIPSIRESGLNKYLSDKELLVNITDGWIGLGGALASTFEAISFSECLNIEEVGFLVNNC